MVSVLGAASVGRGVRVETVRVRPRVLAGALLAAAVLMPDLAHACPACFGAMGEIDSPMATGMNNGILVLLAVIGGVQVGFVALFVSIRQRGKKLQQRRESFRVITGGAR